MVDYSTTNRCEYQKHCNFCPIRTLDESLQVIGHEAVEWALDSLTEAEEFDFVAARLREEFGNQQGGWTEVVRDCYLLEVDINKPNKA